MVSCRRSLSSLPCTQVSSRVIAVPDSIDHAMANCEGVVLARYYVDEDLHP